MTIRIAEKRDIKELQRILLQVNQVHADGRPDLFKNGGIKYTESDLEEKLGRAGELIFVAEENGALLGYSFIEIEENEETTSVYSHKTVYIDDLCVDEVSRGKHIGSALFEYIKQYAHEIDAYRVTLRVWECNPSARAFYDALGLKPMYTEMEMIL